MYTVKLFEKWKLKLDPWRKIFPSELGQKAPSGMHLLVFYLFSFIIIIIHGVYIS